jgi:hypothetical protein
VGNSPSSTAGHGWSFAEHSKNPEFDRLWALALSGRLGFAHLFFTKPHYGKARVASASFSTEWEE